MTWLRGYPGAAAVSFSENEKMPEIKSGFGIENGVDKYTGETLEAIAKRASEAAKADAAAAMVSANVDGVNIVADGTAVSSEGLATRVKEVKSGGKCWSVDEARSVMGDLKA